MNYANVKRDGQFFSIATKPERERFNVELCDKCANVKACSIKKKLDKLTAVRVPVKQCAVFSPYITFSALDGLDLPQYNTIRPHSAWAKRLSVGDKVVAYNSKTKSVIDTRTVTQVTHGPKAQMLQEHARFNHTVLNQDIDDPVAHLTKVLINSMGKNFYNASDELSVIYLSNS